VALLAVGVFVLLLLAAAAWDVTTYRIPNWLCLLVAVAGLALTLPLDGAWLPRLASFAVVAPVVLVLYALKGMGGGDVKLLAATALWIPFPTLPTFILALAVAGGAQALVFIVLRRLRRTAAPSAAPRRRMPYALSIAAAGLWWAWATWPW
jgi:prepilin peptidase CpaA